MNKLTSGSYHTQSDVVQLVLFLYIENIFVTYATAVYEYTGAYVSVFHQMCQENFQQKVEIVIPLLH